MEMAYSDYSQNFIGHGFLAVDFFSAYPGLFIGYAYDDRIGKMGAWEFSIQDDQAASHGYFGSVLGLLAFQFGRYYIIRMTAKWVEKERLIT